MPSFTAKLQTLCSRVVRSSKLSLKKGPASSKQNADLEEIYVPKYLGDYSDYYVASSGSSTPTSSPGSSSSSVLLPPGVTSTISTHAPRKLHDLPERLFLVDSTSWQLKSLSPLSDSDSECNLTTMVYPPGTRLPNFMDAELAQKSQAIAIAQATLTETQSKPECTSRHHLGPCESWVTFTLPDSDSKSSHLPHCDSTTPVPVETQCTSRHHLGPCESWVTFVLPTSSSLHESCPTSALPTAESSAPRGDPYSVLKSANLHPYVFNVDFTFSSHANAAFPMPMPHVPKKASAFRTVCDNLFHPQLLR